MPEETVVQPVEPVVETKPESPTEAKDTPKEGEPATKEEKPKATLMGDEEPEPGEPKAAGEKPEPPEKYELKFPENSPLDKSEVERIASYAKERGLSNDQAQEILEHKHEAVNSFMDAQKAEAKERSEQWVDELANSKDFGGEAFKENVELAKRAFRHFADPELVAIVENPDFPIGNHPGFVKAWLKVGRQISEDKLVRAGAQSNGPKSDAELFYGKKE